VAAGTVESPLELMLDLMGEAARAYRTLSAMGEPEDEKGAERWSRAVRQSRDRAMEAAVAAAPYVHAKLQSVDKTVKKGVNVTVKEFVIQLPEKAPDAG
jgi:hypothetical protein